MMVNVPAPETEGSKIPLTPSVIPVPVQVPPLLAAIRNCGPSVVQKGPAGEMVAFEAAAIVMLSVAVPPHAPGAW